MTLLFSSVLHFFLFVEIIQNRQFFWKKYLVNEFLTAMGGGLLGISKKIVSIFKTWQKMETKFRKWKLFFLISLAIPCPSRSGIHWPIIFSKKNDDSVYFQQQKKVQNWREEKGPGTLLWSSVFFVFFWKYTESSIFLEKWLVNEFQTAMGGGLLGI